MLTAPIARPILPSSPTGKTKSSASAAVIDQTETSDEVPEEQFEAGQQEVETETEEETPSNGSGKPRTYNHRPPKFLDDLDLSKAKQPIADFIAAKGNPTEQNDRYIAVAVWLNESMGIEEFTINHIFTVFDSLGWKSQMPVNHSQPLRDLKTKRHFLTKEANGYKVNWNGIQYVGKMGSN